MNICFFYKIRNLHQFLYNSFNVFINIYNVGFNFLNDFNFSWSFNNSWIFVKLINLRNLLDNRHNLLKDSRHFFDLINYCLYFYYLLFNKLHFFIFCLHNNFFSINYLHFILNVGDIMNNIYLFDSDFLLYLRYNFLNNLRHW